MAFAFELRCSKFDASHFFPPVVFVFLLFKPGEIQGVGAQNVLQECETDGDSDRAGNWAVCVDLDDYSVEDWRV